MRLLIDTAKSSRTVLLVVGTVCARTTGTITLQRNCARNMSTHIKDIPVIRDVRSMRDFSKRLHRASQSIGLVPTMGALHAGHLSLVRQALAENDHVVVSIYVNPTQFGVNEDLNSYPETWDSDIASLRTLNDSIEAQRVPCASRISAIFAPTTKAMYPLQPPTSEIDGPGSFVTLSPLGSILEGASRPVFFRGVATVCMKLFNIVAPDNVYFGQKDVQQTLVIKQMVRDFHLDTTVRILPTSRDADGLAMSSRNVYLGVRRRAIAPILYKALSAAAECVASGHRARVDIMEAAREVLLAEQLRQAKLDGEHRVLFDVDYLSVADRESMNELDQIEASKGAILSGAIKVHALEQVGPDELTGAGGDKIAVRLLDNVLVPAS